VSLQPPEKTRKLQATLHAKAKGSPGYRFYLLYDKVYREDVLAFAYQRCKANGGEAGVDGQSFKDIEAYGVERWLEELAEELRKKTYQPQAVRRVHIPKPDGSKRPLGIPTVRDRVVQGALRQVLEPIFEKEYAEHSYGFRPGKGCKDALRRVDDLIKRGYRHTVDVDLKAYFDSIPHAALLKSLARRISDRRLLRLLKMWLKAPVAEQGPGGGWRFSGGKRATRGTPQGGVVSPALANLYMNRYLKVFRLRGLDRRYGARLVNYADDFVVLCRQGAPEVLAQTRQWFTQMGLTLNERKTRVCDGRSEPFTFLGYTFGPMRYRKDGHWYLGAAPAKKAVQRVKGRVRGILRPGNQAPWDEVRGELNRVLRGWANYFAYGTRLLAYRAVDNYVYQSVRSFLRRRHKVSSRGTTRWADTVVFGELGVLRLRSVHLASSAHASV